MRLNISNRKKVSIIEVHGSFDILNCERFRAKGRDLVKSGRRLLLVDLSHISFMDNSAIAVVLHLWELCEDKGGHLCTMGKQKRLLNVYRVLNLEKLIPIFSTRREAMTYLLLSHTKPLDGEKCILVYSSNDATLKEMLHVLASMGHTQIFSTRAVSEARSVLLHSNLDLVVIDLWSHLTALRRLFQDLEGPNRNVPVIITGLGDENKEEAANSEAASSHRYEIRRFKTLVKSALEGHEISFVDVLRTCLRFHNESRVYKPTSPEPS
jgi:anti-sigma B factor antagonist